MIDNALDKMPDRLEAVKGQLENLYQQQELAKAEVGKPFPFEQELATKTARLIMFAGCCDRKNGSDSFMYGVMTVMEVIAHHAGKYEEFESVFLSNMIESKNKSEI